MTDYDGLDQLRELARRLTVATKNQSVIWEVESPSSFAFSRGRSSVTISSIDSDGQAPFLLEVYDSMGAIVDSYATTMGFGAARDDLAGLFHAARRQALRVDMVINDLLTDLPMDPDLF
jgi:hypothetical protein